MMCPGLPRDRRVRIPTVLLVSALALSLTRDAAAQVANSPNPDHAQSSHSPKGALWRAAVLPGWGQVYNRQYLKLPVLYAAIGGLTYLVVDLNDEYLLYRRAFLYKSFQELVDTGQLESNPNETLKSYYDRLASEFGEIPSAPIRDRRDNLRRNRDLSVVGIGLVYGLSILDAFISAHLLDFDVGEDLTLSLYPGPRGLETTLSVRF